MHICFPSLSYSFNGEATSGVGAQVRLLAHTLVDAGHAVSVIDLATEKSENVTDDRGVEVYRETSGNLHWILSRLPLIGNLLSLPLREIEYSIAVRRGVRKANRQRRIDVVEGTETGMLLVSLWWKKSPFIIRLHGEQYTFHKYTPGLRLTMAVRLSRMLQRIALRRARLLISPSCAHAREIRAELGEPLPPLVVVPNAVCLEKTNGRRWTPDSGKTVLYAGRIEQRKGIKTLLHAAAQTRDALPDSRFVFAGDFHSSISRDEFQSLVRNHHLDANVDLLGPVAWNVLSDLYKTATVAVLPSHYETFGLAALEPMAFGTPVIASGSSALPEVVVHEKNGKLVAAGDCGALADAMIAMLSEPAERERMSKGALEHAALFDVKRLRPLNEQLYEWSVAEALDRVPTHLFFSPHLDDAVLSCGGAIDLLVSQQADVCVISVFTREGDAPPSAFTRHLHAKWGIKTDITQQRRNEDITALHDLGVTEFEHWGFAEAPSRRRSDGEVSYSTYEDLRDDFLADDWQLVDVLTNKIRNLDSVSPNATLYFPLSLGQHIDHRILFEVGRNLCASGLRVRFYEDFPYAENYHRDVQALNWMPRTVSIDLTRKVKAASAYLSQLRGLGGSPRNLEKRLRVFSLRDKLGRPAERFWEPVTEVPIPTRTKASLPLKMLRPSLRFADCKAFLRTFRWHDLNEVLPPGDGDCIDLGCGNGRHRPLIENKGYKWIGLDRRSQMADLECDASAIPVASRTMAAVVAWQVFEYVKQPEQAFAEVARVLESGGVFCGSVSFLEPVHGHTYYNLSPLILRQLLKQNGFADIEIKPGLNGFALLLWTWLRRVGMRPIAYLAIPLVFLTLVPWAACLFCLSWLSKVIGFGDGHFMGWLSRTAPLEFAGHVMFSARKRAS